MEGLARLIAGLPPPEASAAAAQLGTPVLERLQQLMPQLSSAIAPALPFLVFLHYSFPYSLHDMH